MCLLQYFAALLSISTLVYTQPARGLVLSETDIASTSRRERGSRHSLKPAVYLIRHGEKPAKGNSLSDQGEKRAQCLRSVFSRTSQYNIGYVIAEQPKPSEFEIDLGRFLFCNVT